MAATLSGKRSVFASVSHRIGEDRTPFLVCAFHEKLFGVLVMIRLN